MTFEQWWENEKKDVDGASMALLEKLFENAWWTGQNHTIRKEKKYAFNEKGDRRRSFAVKSIAGLDQYFVLASGGSRPGRDDNQPGRRPLGGASFGGRGK